MKKKLVCILICLCLVLITAVNVNAQLPGIINFQAKIADNNGIPLNEPHSFNFSIIDQNSNILWPVDTSVNIPITVENGLYSVKLGDVSLGMEPIPSSIFDENDETYLRIFVDGEQLSDQQILPTGYAFKSEKSDDTHKIAGNPVSGTPNTNQVLKWNGTQWAPGTDEFGGLTLPYSAIYSGSDVAFDITSTSTGDLVEFEIDNSNSNSDVLFLKTNGSGNCLYIKNLGSAEACFIYNEGTEDAFQITNYNVDGGSAVRVNNFSNDEAMYIKQNGLDESVIIEIDNTNSNYYALKVKTNATSDKAATFEGNVYISGSLDVGGSKDFLIDHPLDPENKILRHSCIESHERINIYKGRAKLERGEIKIQLPDYFDALNNPEGRDIFLTSVNGWSPLFLSGKIKNNQFIVKTTKDGNLEQEFSWVIYAVRNDKYAKENPLIVEQEKGVQNGFKKGELLYNRK